MSGRDPLSLPLSILVDSSSPDITYSGSWVSTPPTGDLLDLTRYEEYPFSETLYKASVGTSSLSYTFTGVTSLQVRGTVTNTQTQPGTWDTACNVSPRGPRVVTETFSVEGDEQNDWTFCEVRNLSANTTYTLSFGVDVTSGTPVYFDRLVLVPTDTTDVESALVNVEHRNTLIQYDSSWENPFNVAHLPTAGGAKASIAFTGTSARLYGVWQNVWANGAAQASYSIDGAPSQSFDIPAIPPAYSNLFVRDLLFETPDLPAGPHILEVIAPTATGGRPLAIANFVIQNAPAVPPESDAAGIPQALPVVVPTSPVSDPIPRGETLTEGAKIAIGVCSAVAGLLMFAIVGVLVYRRKQRTSRAQKKEEAANIPSMAFNGHKSSSSIDSKGSFYGEKINTA
ncbi:hypothetical protein CVT24_011504 [Panaeolus cyanescens]|uniref:Uncharacterized protein n=1 Tax=Panaeolus cyanescens TaxID=181874 RepID=A0A409VGP0_9AGAR|nr:hypothetical protein CVT24_011504 [Panaeolus cyanescens]